MRIRARLKVNGIVQGVGFRPFIHKQISRFSLLGWIRNTSDGAETELEGEEADIERFEKGLWTDAPKLALIESVEVEKPLEPKGYTDFKIIESKVNGSRNTLVSPDVCICDDCLRELFDPKCRRYRYPFINCTNCGPRFTIIKDVPYDRPKTTMAEFPMCPVCEKEYKTITDRRYHAQPVCCKDCGPHLEYYDKTGKLLTDEDEEALALAKKALKKGGIVAVKGLGGVHLAARTDLPEASRRLRLGKHRDEKPFAIMCKSSSAAKKFCEISEAEEKLLTSFRRPIVLLKKKDAASFLHLSENDRLGIMLPYTPVHYLLMDGAFESLIMTSANISELPMIYKNDEAIEKLKGAIDGFLLNNRDIHVRCDDSLVWEVDGSEYFARRSRGYVPFPVKLSEDCSGILALGAEQKASFAISRGHYIFPSQHIGDLKNFETLENYEGQIEHFERLFDVKPKLLACDLHPDYMSSDYAEKRAAAENIPLVRVQHHFAHMASCMADNALFEKVLGVVWDGAGLGTDGTVWGCEFFSGDYSGYVREGRLRPIVLPGGDKAVHEIWRTGVSMLSDAGISPFEFFNEDECKKALAQLRAGLNCPKASSMGRLFDGFSALLGIKRNASYEGQGAVLLEAGAMEGDAACYPYNIEDNGKFFEVDWRPILSSAVKDIKSGVKAAAVAARFMNTCIAFAEKSCQKMRERTGLFSVVLSGGSFQNMYLLKGLAAGLEERGFKVYHHKRVSTNDEGICLGQTMIAKYGGGEYVSCGASQNNKD